MTARTTQKMQETSDNGCLASAELEQVSGGYSRQVSWDLWLQVNAGFYAVVEVGTLKGGLHR